MLSLLMLAWGDTAAAFGGRLYKLTFPETEAKKKTFAGSFCAFLAGVLIMRFIYGKGLALDVIGGLICAIGEYVSILGLDDNLTMPIICAILLNVVRIN